MNKLSPSRTLRGTPITSALMLQPGEPTREQIAESLAHERVHMANTCTYAFRAGEDYLVYATRRGEGRWTTTMCAGTKPLAEAGADLDYFASLPAAEPLGRVYGRIERMIADPDDPMKARSVPAPGVAVTLSGESSRTVAATDAKGHYELKVAPGQYSVAPDVGAGVRVYGGPNAVTPIIFRDSQRSRPPLSPRSCRSRSR